MLQFGTFTLLLALSAVTAAKELPEVTAYKRAIAQLSDGRRADVAAAFAAARTLRARLLKTDGGLSYLERLSGRDFAALSASLTGMIINRDEVILAEPDPRFFLRLARERGAASDVAFFETYSATFPDGVWPTYIRPQTDFSGCTDFASGELVRRYGAWQDFRRTHPGAYASTVAELLADIEENAATSTCACGDRQSVVDDLQAFLKRFPDSPVAGRIRKRLDALRSSDAGIRFHCISG